MIFFKMANLKAISYTTLRHHLLSNAQAPGQTPNPESFQGEHLTNYISSQNKNEHISNQLGHILKSTYYVLFSRQMVLCSILQIDALTNKYWMGP